MALSRWNIWLYSSVEPDSKRFMVHTVPKWSCVWAESASFLQLKKRNHTKRLATKHNPRYLTEFFGDFIFHKYNEKADFVVEEKNRHSVGECLFCCK